MRLFLVRHGTAGSRHKWDGPDQFRPLSKKGKRQAEGLVALLESDTISRVVSSPYLRCVQTVEPLADKLGLSVEPSDALAEGTKTKHLMALIRSLQADEIGDGVGDGIVACGHGDGIPLILETLARRDGLRLPKSYPCTKGSTWELSGEDGRYMEARYIPPPA